MKVMTKVTAAFRSGLFRTRGFVAIEVIAIVLLFATPTLARLNDVELGKFLDTYQKVFSEWLSLTTR